MHDYEEANATGDFSSFFGRLVVGLEGESKGRTTRIVLKGTRLPGTLAVSRSGVLDLGATASAVGSLALSDGATLNVGGGALTVTDSFAMAGRITVSGSLADFANVVEPTVDLLTLPAASTCDPGMIDCAVTAGDDSRPAVGATLAVRENGDGTKTLFARVARKAVYVSPTGGGALGTEGSVVLDCKITGNTAYRGGGCRGGAYVRCLFGTNTAAEASWTGCDVFGFHSSSPGGNFIGPTRMFDCLFANEGEGYLSAYNKVELYNCTMSGLGNRGSNNCNLYNCVIRTTKGLSGENGFSRCILGMLPSASETYAHTDCTVESVYLDANARPRRRRSAAIDFGDLEVYLSAWDAAGIDRAYFGTDYAGGPRIVNGVIDAGCGEFNRPPTGGRVIFR